MVAPSRPMMVRITPDTTQVLAAMIAKSAIVHLDALLIYRSLEIKAMIKPLLKLLGTYQDL